MKRGPFGAFVVLGAFWATAARATPTAAQHCEAMKDQATGRYAACRLRAYARGVLTGAPSDPGKCVARQLAAWDSTEARYGAACPTSGDQAAIENQVAQNVAAVAAELAGAPLCGNGVIDAEEACDGADLNGQTCATLGYERGTLACSASCALATSGCQIDRRPASGQTTAYTLGGDDGRVRAGHALSYKDNGDGTINDLNTNLVWEKKVAADGSTNDADLHDADNAYPWLCACQTGGALCGVDADCGANGPCDAGDSLNPDPTCRTIFEWLEQLNAANFAGHNDWRLPNVKELHTLLDYEVCLPAASAAFNGVSCGATCTDLTNPACSCTALNGYWSSSTLANNPSRGWGVDFGYGDVINLDKRYKLPVRAVRGGL